MINDGRMVRLTYEQIDYLQRATFLSPHLRRVLRESIHPMPGHYLQIDAGSADLLQAALTERLAHVGFDASYGPTLEGVILEDLIDSLGVR